MSNVWVSERGRQFTLDGSRSTTSMRVRLVLTPTLTSDFDFRIEGKMHDGHAVEFRSGLTSGGKSE